MQLSGLVLLLLAAYAGASLNDNRIEGGNRMVLVAPVLEPPKDSRTHVTTRSRQFPILVLLSQQNSGQPEAKALSVNSEPVYIQKLEDHGDLKPYKKIREKRTLKSKGGGGGTTVVYVPVSGGGGQYSGGRGHGYQGGCQRGGNSGGYPRGGNYGGGGGGNSYASASANAYSSGKR